MKDFLHLQMSALVVAGMLAFCPQAGAQGFVLSVTNSASSIFVSNSVTYSITLSNQLNQSVTAKVTNQFSGPYLFVNASPTQVTFTNTGTQVIFNVGQLPANNGRAVLTLTVQPTTIGFFSNAVNFSAIEVTNTASTNVVIQVTNIVVLADLGVTIAGPVQTVITNDWMTYTVTATNSGPNAAPNVVLTNTLSGSNYLFNLGTLANGGDVNLQFTVQPTNAGTLTLSASIGSASVLDTNLANNFASTNIPVIAYLPGLLVAVTNTLQSTNFQNGLLEQSILLSNIDTTNVPAARVVVTGLTNRLVNAVGTNNGSPFVYYSTNLASGQSVNLVLQYSPRTAFPFTNGQLHAFAVPVPSWTPPAATSASTNINITRIVRLSSGNVLIEWPAITNRVYTVVYSDNTLFSNAMMAPPSVVAPANRTQWIDYGPPTTVSAPTNSSSRFYRVFLNP